MRDMFRRWLRSPRQRAQDAARLDQARRWHHARLVEMAKPEPIRPGAWGGYPCPACDGPPVRGTQRYSEYGTWSERLHLDLYCAADHHWLINTDMG
jgi:hypothetical protein